MQPPRLIIGSQALLDQRFTVNATVPDSIPVPRQFGFMNAFWEPSPFHAMTRTLLEERFALCVSSTEQMVTFRVLTLVNPGKPGPNLNKLSGGCDRTARDKTDGAAPRPPCNLSLIEGRLTGVVADMRSLADTLGFWASAGEPTFTPFADETGLTGAYEISTRFDVSTFQPVREPGGAGQSSDYPSFADALRRDLGFRLGRQQRPVSILVIEHLEAPTPD